MAILVAVYLLLRSRKSSVRYQMNLDLLASDSSMQFRLYLQYISSWKGVSPKIFRLSENTRRHLFRDIYSGVYTLRTSETINFRHLA